MNNPNQPIPELVERAFDELAEVVDQLRIARNGVADATHFALRAEDVLTELRAATNSVELTEHPDEANLVLPTPEWLTNRRRRRIRVAVCVAVIVILAVALAVV